MTTANLVPGRYRGVAVATVPGPLDEAALRAHFLGREAYRRTRFLVVRAGECTAILRVAKASETELFSPLVKLELLARPQECVFLHRPDLDTAIPSALAAAAVTDAPGASAVVVRGRYEHVNFILNPRPRRVVVREVVPPKPAKLFDQAQRVVAVTEDLPPLELVHEVVDLTEVARAHPAEHYLLPCRGSGVTVAGVKVSYLDERPPLADWTLLGCERSRQIHRWCYGSEPSTVDFCPKRDPAPGVLTKCCLQEEHIEVGEGWVSVPWGSSLEQVREALTGLSRALEPAWAPG
ncbi:MAG: hypothetical protein M3228_04560 [Actinomycetota bacterium]|nr:hypothetical protein [Actinomycetota bacterium]MDQ4009967.1 hypothetical protein [Actinomycetota bacterium]